MKIETRDIRWVSQYLICECGEDMQFQFRVRKPHGMAYLHSCPKCGLAEEVEKEFPAPVWEEVKEQK